MNIWKDSVLRSNDAIEKAIKVLDRESLRIILVADEQGRLQGTVTDGDIRRALMRHCTMDTHLADIMFKDPTTATADDEREAILAMMRNKDLLQVPIVDKRGKIVGLETLQHILEREKLDNPVFLMAGGFGKRLRPLTNNTPKPLLKVGSKPILETILTQFIDAGFHNFFISTHFKAEKVSDHFGDGSKWGVSIQYVHEDTPLGTAGALGLLPKTVPKLPLIMMNGDLLTKVNFKHLLQFHLEQKGKATMCVREYDFQVPYGVIETIGNQISSIVEKPIHKFFVNAGIYVLEPELIEQVDGLEYLDMPNLLESQIKSGEQINSFPLHEYWLDIGHIEEYERANREINE